MVMRALVLAALCVAGPALAADRPPVSPQRDVDVTYAVTQPTPGGQALTQRMRWSVASGKLRVDPPSGGLYMIIDQEHHQMALVKDADRAVLDVQTGAPGMPGAASTAAFTRLGVDQVAGLPCTNWQTTDAANQPVLLCLTNDGVMLRASRGPQVLVEATSVTYASPDPAALVPPPGYKHVSADHP